MTILAKPIRARSALARSVRARSVVAIVLAAAACGAPSSSPPSSHEAPATVTGEHVSESELPVVQLSEEAERRLGLATASVEARTIPAVRRVGGEVMVPAGRALVVTAPVAGVVRAGTTSIEPGARVARGDTLLRLVPLAPVARGLRAGASRDVDAARAALDAAEARLARLGTLVAERAGSQRALEEATVARDVARADLAAAQARARVTDAAPLLSDVAMTVRASEDGIVRSLSVAPGQAVVAGAPLLELVAVEALWVRVPVYSGDLARVDAQAPADVRSIGAPEEAGRSARAVEGPPTADPASATVDRYYALEEGSAAFRPGERVLVELPLRGEREERVVPFASIVRDASGGAWIYECAGERAYRRARVDVARRAGELAVIARGPAPGTCVVSVGAAEVFGSEFPPGH